MEIIGGEKSKSKPIDAPAEYSTLRGPLAALFQGLLGTKGPITSAGGSATVRPNRNPLAGLPAYKGDTTAPITGNEQALLNALMGQSGTGTARNQLLEQTLGGAFLPGQAQANPFLDATIQAAIRPVQEAYEESTRALRGNFARAGHNPAPGQSSPFDRAAALEARGLANALGDIATEISSQAYEAERGRQQAAVPLSQQEVQTTIANLQAQALPRMIQQYGLDKGLELFQNQTQMLLQLLSVLSGLPTATGQLGTTSTGRASTGILPSIAGGASGAALAFG